MKSKVLKVAKVCWESKTEVLNNARVFLKLVKEVKFSRLIKFFDLSGESNLKFYLSKVLKSNNECE